MPNVCNDMVNVFAFSFRFLKINYIEGTFTRAWICPCDMLCPMSTDFEIASKQELSLF